jgi:hypothetical protein
VASGVDLKGNERLGAVSNVQCNQLVLSGRLHFCHWGGVFKACQVNDKNVIGRSSCSAGSGHRMIAIQPAPQIDKDPHNEDEDCSVHHLRHAHAQRCRYGVGR